MAGELDEGTKADDGKLPYHLVSPDALEGMVRVLDFGAKKYAERNWEKGISYSRVFGAAMRHLWAWWRGADLDPETRLNHLHHAACCIHFLAHYTAHPHYTKFDDRPSTTALSTIYADKPASSATVPAHYRIFSEEVYGVKCYHCGMTHALTGEMITREGAVKTCSRCSGPLDFSTIHRVPK